MNRTTRYLEIQKLTRRQKDDQLEALLTKNFPQGNTELTRTFTNGMYVRTFTAYKNQMISSAIHKTEHQYAILKGACSVKVNDGPWELLEAGHQGITLPGTHRWLFIHTDVMVWATYHPNPDNIQDPEVIDALLIDNHINPLLKLN